MAKLERRCMIVANWKMYKTIDQALEFIDAIAPVAKNSSCEVLLAVPFTAIHAAQEWLQARAKDTQLLIGAQNMNDASEGAFTGEVAGMMLKDAGASFVILGHSERRRYFNESDAFINRKVKQALECGLQPLLCVGETYEEHHDNKVHEVIKAQLESCLAGVDKSAADSLVLSYEPIWAVGTGLPATPEVVAEVHHYCREVLAGLWGQEEAKKVPILYGGSVTAKNALDFLHTADVDGLLIGTASLQPESFTKIISLCQNITV